MRADQYAIWKRGHKPFDEVGRLLAFQVVYDLFILRTERLHNKVALKAGCAEGVSALCVQRVDEGLSADLDGRKETKTALVKSPP